MIKYAVDTVQILEKHKTAWDKGSCPECGAPVDRSANVFFCSIHGTEPFEKKSNDNFKRQRNNRAGKK